MEQEDTDKNPQKFCTIKNRLIGGLPKRQIPIPAYNEYPLKDMKHWTKNVYHQVYIKVGWRKAGKIKGIMPIETAAYAEDKVFGNWRLVAPSADGEKSPLQQVITLIRDEIVPIHPVRDEVIDSNKTGRHFLLNKTTNVSNGARWGEFRRNFVREIKIDFNAICESDYDPAMVDEVNGRLNQLLGEYTRWTTTPQPPLLRGSNGENPPYQRGTKGVVINFVLKPETAEDRSSLRFLTIRSGIWMRWTGKPLDFSQFIKPPGAKPICRQMEMYLTLEIR